MSRVYQPITGEYCQIDIGKVNIFRSGNSSFDGESVTIVFEAGCGCSLLAYTWLQTFLSNKFCVLSYDRLGLGWSDEVKSAKRDARATSNRLYQLLLAANVTGPLVLVGHSIASFYLRVFAHEYPQQVRGLVLLDPCHPRQTAVLPAHGVSLWYKLRKRAMILYAKIGLSNIVSPIWELPNNSMNFLPVEAKHELLEQLCRPNSYSTFFLEIDAFDLSARQAASITDLGDLPLLILTAPQQEIDLPPDINWQTYLSAWLSLHRELATLSRKSLQKVISGAGHCTLITKRECAERVAWEIEAFIDDIDL